MSAFESERGDRPANGSVPALAIHVCADVLATEPYRRWTRLISSRDAVQRAARLCEHAGVVDQWMLVGEAATRGALGAALAEAAKLLADDGLLVLTFSGHTERGEGPIEAARWCLFDGPIGVSEVGAQLAQLPSAARVVVIADTCYAGAIARAPRGPQAFLLLGACDEEQSMVERACSELLVRFERLVFAHRGCSAAELKAVLEADTPACERPCVWTDRVSWWSAAVVAPGADRAGAR
jgi:hypothetical protein